ncbi:MAG: lipoprotein insertase outer membrane protein LolB [Acidobacteriota bacterium]
MKLLPALPAVYACCTRVGAFAAFLSAILIVAACSTLSDRPASPSPLATRPLAANFTATGRVAARVTGDDKRGFSGGFVWTHGPAEDVVELLTPLGQIAARMTMTASGAEIETPDRQRTRTSDPEQFLSEALGVTLPVAALSHWLQAVPLARMPFRAEADAMGRPVALWQNGWQIQYITYADETPRAYPTRIQLTQGEIEARMIISEWSAK